MFSYEGICYFIVLLVHSYVCSTLFELPANRRLLPAVRLPSVSIYKCQQECEQRAACLSIVYIRRYGLCQFVETDTRLTIPGVYTVTVPKPDWMKALCQHCNSLRECRINSDNVASCVVDTCSKPSSISGAKRRGNVMTVGSWRLYWCPIVDARFPLRCQGDGTWTDVSLFNCHCLKRENEYHAELTYTLVNETFVEMSIDKCHEGYTLLHIDNPLCNIVNGIWSGLEMSGCFTFNKYPNWRKIYSFHHSFTGSIYKGWMEAVEFVDDKLPYGQFRNSTVLDNWSMYVNKAIRLDIVRDWVNLKYFVFDAYKSTTENWFSRDRLLNSSWSDLNSTTDIDIFSIRGLKKRWRAKFMAMQSVGLNGNCTYDRGWFTITWEYYPCDTIDYTITILFAKGDSVALFHSNETDTGDRIEIWIEE